MRLAKQARAEKLDEERTQSYAHSFADGVKASEEAQEQFKKQLVEMYERHISELTKSLRFAREQIAYFEKLDLAYRKRTHALGGEVGRLSLWIQQLPEPRPGPPIRLKNSEEILIDCPLPESTLPEKTS